jgi:phenylpyruvate tautomerase PptA (4-oxalocrotonate tautomerase family)
MPIVHIHIIKGRPLAQRQALLSAVHSALVEAFHIPPQDSNQILHEHEPEHFQSSKGPSFTLVEISAFAGRSLDAKRALYAAIARNLERDASTSKESLMVVLNEQPLENWGIRGGQAASDVSLGFQVKV